MKEDQMDVIFCTCRTCNYGWKPYGDERTLVPYKVVLPCPKCGVKALHEWYDAETAKKLMQKELGVLPESKVTKDPRVDIADKRMDALEAKLTSIITEQELLRTKLDLITKDQLQKMNAELSDHNFNINSIHTRVNRVEEQIENARKFGKFDKDE